VFNDKKLCNYDVKTGANAKYWERELLQFCFQELMNSFNVMQLHKNILKNYYHFCDRWIRMKYFRYERQVNSFKNLECQAKELFFLYNTLRTSLLPFCSEFLKDCIPRLRQQIMLFPWQEFTIDGTHWITNLLRLYHKGAWYKFDGTMAYVLNEWGFIVNKSILPFASENHHMSCNLMMDPLILNLFHGYWRNECESRIAIIEWECLYENI
jgi:hypothetical protein